MTDTSNFPNYQDLPAGAIPVRLVDAAGTSFYTASGGSGGSSAPYNYTDLGYVQMTSLAAAQGLSSIPAGAKYAFITVEGAAIRFRGDGVPPTASVGIPVAVGSQIMISTNLANVEVIQQASGAILNIQYAL
jgi:hypothetical protein